jgi:two-component system, chemotaxis family, protein-glutamate methylesterase/glutaminase
MSNGAPTGRRIRVLVVDDSAFMRTALSRMIESEPDLEVVGSANSGAGALDKIVLLDPDVVTLDVSMPGLDGLATLRCIMSQCPRPVLMVSATTEKDADTTLSALSIGAFDCVPKQLSKESLDIMHIRPDLISKIRVAGHAHRPLPDQRPHAKKTAASFVVSQSHSPAVAPEVVAIGVSTGGPKALEYMLPCFPKNFSLPILIVQHMPAGFTAPFAQRLNSLGTLTVREAIHHERVESGVAYIAPAGLHMRVVRGFSDPRPILSLDPQPEDALHIPSIDVLLDSVADVYRSSAIGVIMTGMGSDGAEGMSAIFRQGGLTIGQDEASCAVYGMPRVCANLGILNRIVPLTEIPTQILLAVSRRRRA